MLQLTLTCPRRSTISLTFETKIPSSLGSRGLPFDPLPPPRMLSPSFCPVAFFKSTSCTHKTSTDRTSGRDMGPVYRKIQWTDGLVLLTLSPGG